MKVLVLCDNFVQVKRFNKKFQNDFNIEYLICNNRECMIIYLLKQVLYILKSRGIRDFLKLFFSKKIYYHFSNINSNRSIAFILNKQYDIGLHSMGVIYSERVIRAFREGILNSHIGILPKYRGRSVVEWSILQGDNIGISCFFIDGGIDTGQRIVLKKEYGINGFKTVKELKQFLFLEDINMYYAALQHLRSHPKMFMSNDLNCGKRYYVMSNFLLSVVDDWMQNNG